MKMTDGYLLKDIVGNKVAIPVGQNVVDYKGILHLNETGSYILTQLQDELTYDELLQRIIKEYEVEDNEVDLVKHDLDEFLEDAYQNHLITR